MGRSGAGSDWAMTRAEVRRWLEWTTLSYSELDRLRQPAYGDRAISLRQSDQLIGICGFVPCLDAFGQLPSFAIRRLAKRSEEHTSELQSHLNLVCRLL